MRDVLKFVMEMVAERDESAGGVLTGLRCFLRTACQAALVFVVAVSVCSCGGGGRMQEAEAYRADSLAFVLSQLYGLDQGVRMLGLRGEEVAAIRRADSLTFGQFLAFVSEYGFPTAELVGEDNFSRECVCMLGYVVMLHNPHRLLEPETFRLLCGEVRAGRLNPEVFGWALDRYFVTYEGYSLFNSPYRAVRALQGVPRSRRAASDSLHAAIGHPLLPDSVFVE